MVRYSIIYDVYTVIYVYYNKKIYEKYKSKVVFPRDFVHRMHRYKDPTVAVSLGASVYRTSRRVQERGYHKLGHSFLAEADGEDISKPLQTATTSPVHQPSGLHIDYAYAIAMGYHKEKYYLIMVVDGIDFVWASSTTTRTAPEDLILEFLNMTGIKFSTIRFDGAQEFGKSLSFQAFCRARNIVLEPVAEYTHVQNARSENAIRVSKEHVRCLLRASNVPRNFLAICFDTFSSMFLDRMSPVICLVHIRLSPIQHMMTELLRVCGLVTIYAPQILMV